MSALFAFVIAMGIGSAARGDDAKCQDAVAKGSRNVGNQEQKNDRSCVKNGSGDIDACIDAEGAKAAVKRTKLTDLFATGGKCDPVPAIGVNGTGLGTAIADGTEKAIDDVHRAVFGDPVDGIVAGSKCDDKIAKRAGKKFDTELKAFRACVKNSAPLASQAAVDACVAAGVNDAKAQSTVQPKLDADVAAQCTTSPPEGADDGDCSTCASSAACSACIGDIVDCQACLAMNNSANGTADCDTLDDGVVNSSCTGGPVVDCPIAAGKYTVTQGTGGTLKVYTFAAFPFPAGGTIVQDVAAASLPDCVHDTVVPMPGGFSAPNFCVPALGYTVSVTQTGCGVGQVDSNGGSDYKIEETNDTSNNGTPCNLPQAGCTVGADGSTRVDVTVGDGAPDVCAGSGTANVIVTVPVHTKTWQDNSAGTFGACMGDGVFNAGDMVITEFDQILDFTSDEAHSTWADLPDNGGAGDGCFLAGGGPAAGQALIKGECLDIAAMTIKAVAAGGFGSTGVPNDGSFSTQLPSTIALTGPFAGDTCGSPPPINFAGGTATRCLP
jgi:hypothetical protein